MNKFLLYLIMLPSAIWRGLGADTGQLRAILHTRLMLDDRKPVSMMRSPKQKKDRKYGSVLNVVVSAGVGMFYLFPLMAIPDRIFSMTVYFSIFLTFITFMLITDFSNVLFDARDKYILFPRPVNDRTIVLARMLHVVIYLIRIVVPMSLAGWVYLGITDGWLSAVLFILPLLLLVFMALFIVNSVYLLVLRLAKPEKFRDIINYFQVFTSVLFFICIYFMPRFFDPERGLDFSILHVPWVRYSPSYWLGVCWSWIGFPVALKGTAALSALAVAVPLVCMVVLVKYLAPQFARRIGGIDAVDTGNYDPTKKVKRSAGKWYLRMATMFNRSSDAQAGFMIAWLQTSRSRSFKMRVYPSFAFVPVYFIWLLTSHSSLSEAFARLETGRMHLVLLYMTSFVMTSSMQYLTMSEQYKAAWVYYATPVEMPGRIMTGALKALLVKYFLPFFIAVAAFVLWVWGAGAIWDVILALVNVVVFVFIIARVSFRQLPFSQLEQMKQGGNRFLKTMISMLIPFGLGAGHFFAMNLLWLKLIFLGLSCMLLWLVWESYRTTTWANVWKSEIE